MSSHSDGKELERIFPGSGEMARRIRSFDWSNTALGPPEAWPTTLKTSVRIVLTSHYPMFIWWGEQLINIYNDGCAAFLCARHPAALAQPAAAVWPEIWDHVGPRTEFVMHRDEGTCDEALPLIVLRKGYPEEMYVTASYSPIPDASGSTGGILGSVIEETQRIIGERQVALLRELATKTAEPRTSEDACILSAGALRTNADDLPFVLIYTIDGAKRQHPWSLHPGLLTAAEPHPERCRSIARAYGRWGRFSANVAHFECRV